MWSSSMGYSRYWKATGLSPRSRQRSARAAASSTTRAAAGHADAARIDPQIARVIDDVTQALVAIIEWQRVWRFRRESVFDTDADAGQRAAPFSQAGVVHIAVADHHPAAVHPVEDREVADGIAGRSTVILTPPSVRSSARCVRCPAPRRA